MSKPKFVLLIEGMNVPELTALKKHILSKTSTDSEVYYLFDYIFKRRHSPALIESVEILVQRLFPKSSIKTVSNYLSTLFSWSEEWIIKSQLDKEKYKGDLLVLKWLNKKGFHNLADQTARKIEKNIEASTKFDIDDQKSKADFLYYQLISNNPYKYEVKDERFTEMVLAYNDAVKAQYLIFQAELTNWGSMINHDYSNLQEYISRIITQIDDTPLTDILTKVNLLVHNNDVDAFYYLTQCLFDHKIDVECDLHYVVAAYCISRSIRLWTKGLITDPKNISDIYDYGLKSGVLLTNGKIQSPSFHNIVMVLTQANTFDEVEAFIDKWLPQVSTENMEATRSLAMAQNCFYFGLYNEIFRYTWRSDFPTFNQKNTAQGLHLIAAFIQRDKDPALFQNALTSSQYFMKRNKEKMSKHIFESYTNLIDFIIKYSKGLITEKTLTYQPIMYKSWCEQMLKKIKD